MTTSFTFVCATNDLFETRLMTVTFVSFFIAIVMGWIVIILRHLSKMSNSAVINFSEFVWMVAKTLSTCIAVAALSYNSCISEEVGPAQNTIYFIGSCRSKLISDTLIILAMFHPLLLSVITKSIPFVVSLGSWMCGSITIIAVICSLEAYKAFFIFSFMFLITLIFMCEFQRQNTALYFSTLETRNVRRENDRRNEVKATEFSHTIGNVAHDLKTPLAGFLSGMETAKNLCSEIRDALHVLFQYEKLHDLGHSVRAKLAAVDECIEDMRGVYAFMLMSVNRCIDYTSVSNNVQLQPSLETVNLYEALLMPLRCVERAKDTIPIVFEPLSRRICSHIITDKQWLQENILCLLSNAVKYSSKGTGNLEVLIMTRVDSTENAAGWDTVEMTRNSCLVLEAETVDGRGIKRQQYFLRIKVEDCGECLSEDEMKALFKPMLQAGRSSGGAGLGLFSLASRAEALGGAYGAYQRTDGRRGSVFWFEIPYHPDVSAARLHYSTPKSSSTIQRSRRLVLRSMSEESEDPASLTVNRDAIASSLSSVALNVLVVDDSLSLQKMIGNLFRKSGFTVSVAENGAEALSILSMELSAPPLLTEEDSLKTCQTTDIQRVTAPVFDVVLMDFQMPVMGGIEATRRIRKWEQHWNEVCGSELHQLIIGASANSDDVTVLEGLEAGMDAFLAKPFSLQTFRETYARLLLKQKRK